MKRTFRRRGAVLAAALVLLCAVSFADRGGPASFEATGWALLPPAVAIVLAFATKEVYSSLLAGCVVGAMLTEFSLQFGSTWYPLIPDNRLTL